jgi:hypothetical protein
MHRTASKAKLHRALPEIIRIYYIAALDLSDQSGNVGAAAVTKPERLFT